MGSTPAMALKWASSLRNLQAAAVAYHLVNGSDDDADGDDDGRLRSSTTAEEREARSAALAVALGKAKGKPVFAYDETAGRVVAPGHGGGGGPIRAQPALAIRSPLAGATTPPVAVPVAAPAAPVAAPASWGAVRQGAPQGMPTEMTQGMPTESGGRALQAGFGGGGSLEPRAPATLSAAPHAPRAVVPAASPASPSVLLPQAASVAPSPPMSTGSLSMPVSGHSPVEGWNLGRASQLPSRKSLAKTVAKEAGERKAVPEHLKPRAGEVNAPSTSALATASAGQERKVSQRRSVTAHRCFATGANGVGCETLHVRDSPFCHAHAHCDPTYAAPASGGGATSQLEDEINKAIELEMDHVRFLPETAGAEGAAVHAALPPHLKDEFRDPIECYQLAAQFQVKGRPLQQPQVSACLSLWWALGGTLGCWCGAVGLARGTTSVRRLCVVCACTACAWLSHSTSSFTHPRIPPP